MDLSKTNNLADMIDESVIKKLYPLFLESKGAATNTKNIARGEMFFALKGEKFNANLFVEDALNNKASYAVVDEIAKPELKEIWGEKIILVDNVLQTLQQLARYHRQQLKCPVLAITGSNGKTTTKELIAAVMSKKMKTYATKGNLNNHIGIPLTLLSIKSDARFAIVEMGANHQGEIASYCKYVQPDFGLITNIGNAHLEGFGGFEGVLKGKTELYADLAKRHARVFVSADNELLLNQLAYYTGISNVISYGKFPDAFCRGEIRNGKDFLAVESEGTRIQTNLVGDYNFENVMSAVCVGKYFGVELKLIKEAIENYVPSNNRSQKISYGTNTVILDAYNANPSSMAEALKNFERINAKNKIAILGEMMELGDYAKAEHEKIKSQTDKMQLQKKIFVGNGFGVALGSDLRSDPNVVWFEKTDELKEWFKQQQFENYFILIKGSRKNELEKILKD